MSLTDEDPAIEEIKKMALKAANAGCRDAHPKAHGCVRARFIVDAHRLPPEAQAGIFRQPRTFDAWIRFSNANQQPGPDTQPDVRGIAIKLLGVEGKKLLENEQDATTQDFVLISHEVFFARTPTEFLHVLGLAKNERLKQEPGFEPGKEPKGFTADLEPLRLRLANQLRILMECQESALRNPLGGTYWSTVPFKLGQRRVKYRAQSQTRVRTIGNADPDFLRKAMKAHLAVEEACLEFCVQLDKDEATTPVEDPTKPWPTEFIPVAKIVIPPQDFDSPEQNKFCENLSFTPWHSIQEHEPLGAINLARKPIYDTVSERRHSFIGVARTEPK